MNFCMGQFSALTFIHTNSWYHTYSQSLTGTQYRTRIALPSYTLRNGKASSLLIWADNPALGAPQLRRR